MTSSREIAAYADLLLDTRATPDYPSALNGLQLDNRAEVQGIAAAVDFSSRAIQGAIAAHANLLIVHHGMFWNGPEQIVGPHLSRLEGLLANGIAVYAAHLPLDRHSTLGNNVLLARELTLEPTDGFALHEGIFIGVAGTCDVQTAVLFNRCKEFAEREGGTARMSCVSPSHRTRKWAICSGAGASADTLSEAIGRNVDTLIVGEGPHWTAVAAEEYDIALIYAGHYATETLGVRALSQHLGDKYGIPWGFISAPTGL